MTLLRNLGFSQAFWRPSIQRRKESEHGEEGVGHFTARADAPMVVTRLHLMRGGEGTLASNVVGFVSRKERRPRPHHEDTLKHFCGGGP